MKAERWAAPSAFPEPCKLQQSKFSVPGNSSLSWPLPCWARTAPLQQILASALRQGSVLAHAADRFGSRQRTVARLAQNPQRVFIADQRPLPLPPFVRRVYLTRLPFPSLENPVVLSALESLPPDVDAFGEVILPQMLQQLASTVVRPTGRRCGNQS